jgi:hypothetical protein
MICKLLYFVKVKKDDRMLVLLQMMSLSKLIAAKIAKPNSQPVKVTVVEVGRCNKYKTEKGKDKEITVVEACDREHAIKLNVYNPVKVALLKEGGCVMLLNYIFKQEPDSQPVKVTVVEVGRCNKYKTEKGEDKELQWWGHVTESMP